MGRHQKSAWMHFRRTAIGAWQGMHRQTPATTLAASCVADLLHASPTLNTHVDRIILGQVLNAGSGQHPAKQVATECFKHKRLDALNVNKVCGSGMMAIALAHDQICLQHSRMILAGGMENMSLTPYLLPRQTPQNTQASSNPIDHMMMDGLTSHGQTMGCIAEADRGQITRAQQDAYAVKSHQNYINSLSLKSVTRSIVGKPHANNPQPDETTHAFNQNKMTTLKPIFSDQGTITAANASSLADGAAVCAIAHPDCIAPHEVQAWLLGYACSTVPPSQFMRAPAIAVRSLLNQLGWSMSDVDLFEINEAFAITVLHNIDALDLHMDQVNVLGGACTMGHPLGMSGARILGQLYHALVSKQKHRGIAAICIGGGEAIAMAMEVEQACN